MKYQYTSSNGNQGTLWKGWLRVGEFQREEWGTREFFGTSAQSLHATKPF